MATKLKKKKLLKIVGNIGGANVVRRETLHGRSFVVAPGAMLAEAVLNGSEGPGFYAAPVIEESVPNWDHKPIVAYHPEDEFGNLISAADRDVLDAQQVGFLLNTKFDDKLRTEHWIDEVLCNEVDDRIIPALEKGQQVETSTGLLRKRSDVSGEHNGVHYDWTVDKIIPNHLAILYDQKGAYSIAQGGGLLTVNSAGAGHKKNPPLVRSVREVLTSIGGKLVGNELSFSDISCQLSDALSSKFGEKGKYWQGWITDVFPDSVVFRDSNDEYQMISYTVKDDQVSLTGDAVAVKKVFQPVTANAAAGETIPKKENQMDEKAKKAYIDALIGNKASGWNEEDRKTLEGLADATLQKIKAPVTANAETKEQKTTTEAATTTAPAVTPATGAKPMTFQDLVANSDADTQRMLNRMKNTFIRTRTKNKEAVKLVTNKFSDAQLDAMDDDVLETLAETLSAKSAVVNDGFGGFFGAVGTVVGNKGGGDEEALGSPEDNTSDAK